MNKKPRRYTRSMQQFKIRLTYKTHNSEATSTHVLRVELKRLHRYYTILWLGQCWNM